SYRWSPPGDLGGRVSQRREQISSQVRDVGQSRPALSQADEDFLHGVLGVWPRAEQGVGHAEQRGAVAREQRCKRLVPPAGEVGDQPVARWFRHASILTQTQ